MYREMIDYLAFVYGFICKGRGMMEKGDMERISGGAHAMVENAPAVLGTRDATAQDDRDLMECDKILEHVDEMIVFLNVTEVI